MMTSLKLKWMEKHKVLHCFILINLQQPTVKSPKYMFPHIFIAPAYCLHLYDFLSIVSFHGIEHAGDQNF